MKVALINPPQPYLVSPGEWRSLGLEYILGAIRKHCRWVDAKVVDLGAFTMEQAVRALQGYAVCAYTATTLDYKRACGLACAVRAKYNSVQVIGGPHVTVTKPRHPVWDVVFKGEGEETFIRFLHDWRGEAEYIGKRIVDLDALAVPVREGLNGRPATIIGSRGCAFNCAFCASQGVWGNKVRYRKPRNVAEEIRTIRNDHETTHFDIFDENLMSSKTWLREFCQAVAPLGIEWRANARVDDAGAEHLTLMRDAGCMEVGFGIESFDDKVLTALGKKTTHLQNVAAIRAAHSVGLRTRLYMMISTPGESYKTTVDYNILWLGDKLKDQYDVLRFYLFIPRPGSPIYERPADFGVSVIRDDANRSSRDLYQRDATGLSCSPMPSPITIHGMTRQEQAENVERMFAFAQSIAQSKQALKGLAT